MAVKWTALPGLALGEVSFAAPWQLVVDFIEDVNLLRIVAKGEWEALPGIAPHCGPDGLAGLPVTGDALILPSCRIGTLIGKLGGSSAGDPPTTPAEGSTAAVAPGVFAIGTGCLVPIPTGVRGPLFIGLNSHARPIALSSLTLSVWGATIA